MIGWMRLLAAACVLVVCATQSAGQIPPGYQVVQVTQNPNWELHTSMNNRGQIVFEYYRDTYDANTGEIFLYDHGVLTQLTDDYVWDRIPDINDDGVVVWSRYSGINATAEIAMLRDDVKTLLTSDDMDDEHARINNAGHVAWKKRLGEGCANSVSNICFFDGQTASTIVADGLSNQTVCINDFDELAWTRYNFCNDPWTSEVMLYSGGVIKPLTSWQYAAVVGDINNQGTVSWYYRRLPDYANIIQLWSNGTTTTLTEWGSDSRLTDSGDVFFNRWYEDTQTWQVWMWRGDAFFQISNDPCWNWVGRINERGELVWSSGNPYETDVRWLRPPTDGDVNCDGTVSILDVNPFVLALSDAPAYRALYPLCDELLADMNGDLLANILDINGFVAALSAQR